MLELVPYDSAWPTRFLALRDSLKEVLPSAAIAHVGSTSVPGLSSKDTIDLLVAVPDVPASLSPGVLARLSRRGYHHRPGSFPDDPDHEFLRRGEGPRRDAHVHVVRLGSPTHETMLLLRDYLRAEPRVAARYQRIKLALLASSGGRRYEYVDRKVPVVDAMIEDARRWAHRTGWSAQVVDP